MGYERLSALADARESRKNLVMFQSVSHECGFTVSGDAVPEPPPGFPQPEPPKPPIAPPLSDPPIPIPRPGEAPVPPEAPDFPVPQEAPVIDPTPGPMPPMEMRYQTLH